MLHDLDRQRMALGREVLQDADVGRPRAGLVALAARQVLLVEQDLAQLLGRADIERAGRRSCGSRCSSSSIRFSNSADRVRRRGASTLMPAVSMPSSTGISGRSIVSYRPTMCSLASRGLKLRPQLQGDVGVLGGVVARLVDRHLVEAHLLGAAAGDVGELDGLLAEIELGQLVHAVVVLAGVEHEGQQHGVVDRADLDAVAAQHAHVVLDVLADLQHRGVFQQRLQLVDHRLERELARQQLAGVILGALVVAAARSSAPCASPPGARWPIGR